MRFIVFFLGFIGCVLTASLGLMIFCQVPIRKDVETELKQRYDEKKADEKKQLDEQLKNVDLVFNMFDKDYLPTGFFMLLSALIGFLGALLAFFRCGWQGAALLFVPLLGPAVLNPTTLGGTALQSFAALLCILFIRPLPIPTEKKDKDEDDD
jgi:hypothetical protein